MIYIDSGGGHRAAANALSEVIRQQQRPWMWRWSRFKTCSTASISFAITPAFVSRIVTTSMLRQRLDAGTAQLIPMMHGVIRASHDAQVHEIEKYWEKRRPD